MKQVLPTICTRYIYNSLYSHILYYYEILNRAIQCTEILTIY